MHHTRKLVAALFVTVFLGAGWAVFAQVQEKAKTKPVPAKKTEAGPTRPAAAKEAPATPAAPAKGKAGENEKGKDAAKPADKHAADKHDHDHGDAKPEEEDSEDQAAIRSSAADFVAAYNAHDSKAVSELFAPRAEFTDEDGKLIKGREAIEQDFAEMFAEHPECKIAVEIESIRMLTPNIGLEEGIVRGQPTPDGDENVSSYVAIHVKVEGNWLIGSVSDFEAPAEALTAHDHLQSLEWMVGDWIDESPDSVVKSACQWDDSGNYLLHEFEVHLAGEVSRSGSMRIGWDPLTLRLKSWTFDADGSWSEGQWIRIGDEWVVKSQGVNAAGEITSAVNVFRFVDNDTMTWRSYDRIIGGQPADDIPENVIKRHAPPPEG